MKVLKVKRVSYGKKGMQLCDREYKIPGRTPVGCINELLEHVAKPNGFDKIILNDIDGVYEVDVKKGFDSLVKTKEKICSN